MATPEVIDQLLAIANKTANIAGKSNEEAKEAKELAEALGLKIGVSDAKFKINENGHLKLEYEEARN